LKVVRTGSPLRKEGRGGLSRLDKSSAEALGSIGVTKGKTKKKKNPMQEPKKTHTAAKRGLNSKKKKKSGIVYIHLF